MKNKRWLTIFPELKQEHLNKDVGLIPDIMQLQKKYVSSILAVNPENGINEFTECEIIGINCDYLGKNIAVARFLINNAKKFDVINLYHFSLCETILWVLPYKMINRRGKVYLKMDLSTKYMHDYVDNKLMLFLRRRVIFLYDVITVESTIVCRFINRYYKNKVKLLPNGYWWNSITDLEDNARKNELLYVARIGAECKNSELLIKAFNITFHKHNWNLRMVGTIENSFEQWYKEYLSINPHLKDRIIFQGSVYDRNEMARLYSESKIFVLCSDYESFGIVLVEALSQGCYLIATDGINSISDIVIDSDIGIISKSGNEEDLADKILASIGNTSCYLRDKVEYRKAFANRQYSWDVLCNKVYELLNEE